MTVALGAVETREGVRVPNFFNGRILAAEDLRLLLRADRRHRALLGQALGPGIAGGLRVTRGGAGVLTVSAGAAVNALGETVELPVEVPVPVAGSGPAADGTATTVSAGVFVDCGTAAPGPGATNAFLLTVRPDSVETGSAPADPYLAGGPCGPGYVAEGVRFRRVPFDPTWVAATLGVTGTAGLGTASPLSRNVVSHLFLGTPRWLDFCDVATAEQTPHLRAAEALVGLQPCEVPLALFYLHGTDVGQVDEWAVRRPCRPLDGEGLGAFASAERGVLGTATLLQFQAQLTALDGVPGGARAGTHLRYLPAAGVLSAAHLGSPASLAEFQTAPLPFFASLPANAWRRADRAVRSARVEALLRDGTQLTPVDLLDATALPVTVVPVHESFLAGHPYAVFVAAEHPYQDRIELDRVADLVAGLTPDAGTPQVTVVKTDHSMFTITGRGIVVDVQYKVVCGTAAEYVLSPIAEKPKASLKFTVRSEVDGGGQQQLQEGSNVVVVSHLVRTGFASAGGGRDPDEPDDVVVGIIGTKLRDELGTRGPELRLGLDVQLVDDPEVSGRATFLLPLPGR